MKLSKYVTNLDLDENKKMLYSTLERKYILYDKSEEKNIILFLSQLNKGSNIFQNTEKISTFNLYKQAIEKGYLYINRWNMYAPCHACQKNAIVIDTDGSILLCAGTDEDEKRVGYIGAKGNVCLEREATLFDLHSTTARNNPDCRDCIELPFCIGSCRYARMKENTKCQGKSNDGLSLHERALLDYYSDIQKIQGGTDNE